MTAESFIVCHWALWHTLFFVLFTYTHLTSQPWYMRSLRVGWTIVTVSSTVWVWPVFSLYRTCSTPQLESYCVSASSTMSPLTFEINFIGCPFSRQSNTKCVSWCRSVCIRQHQHTSLNCAHRCLNQPIVVTSVQLLWVTLQFHVPEQRDTARDVLLFLVQHSGTHSHCLLVIHHWHWLSSVRVWRLCYSAEHTKH